MTQTKKCVLETIAILVALIVIIALIVNCVVYHVNMYQYEVHYWKYRNELNYVAKTLLSDYHEDLQKENISHIWVQPIGDTLWVIYHYTDNTQPLHTYVSSNEDLQKRLKILNKALPTDDEGRGGFADIILTSDQVTFTTHGDYYLVYSEHGRPQDTFDSTTETNVSYYISKSSFRWYHMVNQRRGITKSP